MANLILVTGGARSGKSRFAEQLLTDVATVTYIATAEALDSEMETRIALHRARRPAHWQTVESPLHLDKALQAATGAYVLIDCLAVWTANLLQKNWNEQTDNWAAAASPEETILAEVQRVLEVIATRPGTVIAVTNEVGSGLVPPYRLGRVYRDVLGLANQKLASAATQVYCCISGIPVLIKGGK
jgi:adenosylcobinamide kinase/adenosylcobinamide-phosphate guanylyltransferase